MIAEVLADLLADLSTTIIVVVVDVDVAVTIFVAMVVPPIVMLIGKVVMGMRVMLTPVCRISSRRSSKARPYNEGAGSQQPAESATERRPSICDRRVIDLRMSITILHREDLPPASCCRRVNYSPTRLR